MTYAAPTELIGQPQVSYGTQAVTYAQPAQVQSAYAAQPVTYQQASYQPAMYQQPAAAQMTTMGGGFAQYEPTAQALPTNILPQAPSMVAYPQMPGASMANPSVAAGGFDTHAVAEPTAMMPAEPVPAAATLPAPTSSAAPKK